MSYLSKKKCDDAVVQTKLPKVNFELEIVDDKDDDLTGLSLYCRFRT
jgi:hypothetical protein